MISSFKKTGLVLIVSVLFLTLTAPVSYAVDLDVFTMFGGADPASGAYQDAISEFESMYDVNINDDSSTMDDAVKVRIENAFQANNEPDLTMYFTDEQASPIINSNNVVPYTGEIFQEYPELKDRYLEDPLEQQRWNDGNIYGIPVTGFYEGLLINKDLFEKHDVPLPTNWENFMTAIERFNEEDIVPLGVGLGRIPHYMLEHAILVMGGAEQHNAGLKDGVPQGWIDGLNLIKELYEMDAFPVDTLNMGWEQPREMFRRKEVAMLPEGNWALGALSEIHDTMTILPMPVPPEGRGEYGSIIAGFTSGFYISEEAYQDEEKGEMVIELVKHLTSKDVMADIVEANAGLPSVKGINVDDLEGLSRVEREGVDLANQASNIVLPTDAKISRPAFQEIVNGVPYIVEGERTAEEVLESAREIEMEARRGEE